MGLFFSNISIDTACILIGIFTLFYAFVKYRYTYWERKGFKSLPPTFPLGHLGPVFAQKCNFGELIGKVYNSTSEPFIGIFAALRPILVIRDPELIRNVFVKDFSTFMDRGVYIDEEHDPLSGHLFALEGQKWKNLRGKLSPTFTSGKLKAMFSTIVDCSEALEKFLENASKTNETVEVRDLAANHATNVIASVAFGIQLNCITDTNNDFRKFGRRVFQPSFKNALRGIMTFINPNLLKYTKIRGIDHDVEEFMMSVVKQNVEYREKNNITRKDFFQLLIQLRNTGTVQLDDQWETVIKNGAEKGMSMGELAAQAFVFFLAGFETSSSTMSFALYEFAKNPAIQQRVQDEIDEVLKRHNGKITYDAVNEMKYLECCIDETLRKYPPVPILNRVCNQNYKIPDTNLTIEKDTHIFIPALALQHDEKYYPEPLRFDPDRFSEENSVGMNFVNRPYMPFGDGPRICIGMRMGKMQTQVGLIAMLQHFKYELGASHTEPELKYEPSSFLLTPVGGICLRVSKR